MIKTKIDRRSKSSKLPPIGRKFSSIPTIGKVAPTNIIDQQDYFFKNNCAVNPILNYSHNSQSDYTNKFKVSSKYLLEATTILDNCLRDFKTESNYFESDGGKLLTNEETVECFDKYMSSLGLENMLTINFSNEAIAPTAVNYNPKTNKCVATVALPIFYRENRISGVLHHELGTHLLRSLNDKKQVWNNKRKKWGLKHYVETEEGLATIHTNIDGAFTVGRKPYLWSAALHYYASFKASQMSFVELFADLEKYIDNPIKRFKETLRVKRGLSDTGKPGGCYKDQVYLSGAIKILKARWKIDFKELYAGKIALEDYFRDEVRAVMKSSEIILPAFMNDMAVYRKALDNIAKTNGIDFS
jgi:hypothetical protein